MFDIFTKKIVSVLDKLRNSGTLTEKDIDLALREIRISLLSADVSLSVAKKFIENIKEKASGQEVMKALSPGQTVVKIVRDELVKLLGSENSQIDFSRSPTKIMLVGLQGAGKTTMCAKIAHLFKKQNKSKTVSLTSVDFYRPAAIEQLSILSQKIDANFYSPDTSKKSAKNVENFLKNGKEMDYDLMILDTAGRLQIDEEKMDELEELKEVFNPNEIILVADITTGQDAINIAKTFNEKLNLTGIILTRVDGDAKGGVAISMRDVTGVPVKYLGTGENIDKIEQFTPERIADRILDMGDILSLIEKTRESMSDDDIMSTAQKMMSGNIDLNDFADILKKMQKIGGFMSLLKFMPQFSKISEMIGDKKIDEKMPNRVIAMINSMTKLERRNPSILNASRKKRIVAGSGTTIQELNRLLKQFEDMQKMFKIMRNPRNSALNKITGKFMR